MKNIDLLPEWYKSGQRQRVSYRTQCIAFGGIFLVMMVWSFMTSHLISKATADLIDLETRQILTRRASLEVGRIRDEISQLRKKANVLDEVDSNIDIANVLAEISFLIDNSIVLGKVEFTAEKFVSGQGTKSSSRSSNVVRTAGRGFGSTKSLSLGDVRFKVVIGGIAADSSDMAKLVCKLEDSPYFRQVYPLFSRNKKMNNEGYQVSEFEIGCYLANYNE
ncbi:MAG: hypothetical protein KAS75_07475 [Planctomycetes bacterium]|nr:hypothetical protein [Planctomycetota bacterium]